MDKKANKAKYLIRLDDLCPNNNLSKWERFYNLLDKYGIKPIIAVIPNNKDLKLLACGSYNLDYWGLVRRLQKKDYAIAMHGFEHRYVSHSPGILKLNFKSEFAGLPLDEQEKKIRDATSIFERENVKTNIFIAPSHTFDLNTIKALKSYSHVDIISDGLLKFPYIRFGFRWIPVQLSGVVRKKRSIWTFNYHPETCTDLEFKKLENFITKYHNQFISIEDLSFKPYTWYNYLHEQYCIYSRLSMSFLKDRISFRFNSTERSL